jgi:pantoate--beta-alanine ligase
MKVAQTIELVRSLVKDARCQGKIIGLVPTMGALHIGHISLIEAARKKCDFVVVSIFVNPTQFGPGEDFERYPRPIEKDLEMCENAGVDVVFAPSVEQMYPSKNLTWVNVEKITEPLCGRSRPGHFCGVSTVCTKLFNIVAPDIAFFGQKDAQQVAVIQAMVQDLNMPLEIVVCPTVREPDGLAISSRNQYLGQQERADAVYVYKSLKKCREMFESGITETGKIIAEMKKVLQQKPSIEIEYINIVDAKTLEDINKIEGKTLVAVAARLSRTRLIDNILIDTND